MSLEANYFGTLDPPVNITCLSVHTTTMHVTGNLSVDGTSTLTLDATAFGDLIMGDATTKGGDIKVYRDTSGNLGFNYVSATGLSMTDDILMGSTYKVQFRDSAIHIESSDDGHLDLTADTTIDLNASTVISGDYLSIGTNPASSGVIRIANNQYVKARNAANTGDISIFYVNASNELGIVAPTTSTTSYWYFVGGQPIFRSSLSTVKTIAIGLSIQNSAIAADMDGTGSSLYWMQRYNDATPAYVNSGQLVVATETDWTATASTQDSYMAFYTTLNGTCAEKVRIDSAGKMWFGSGTALDTCLYRSATNQIKTDDNVYVAGYVFTNSYFESSMPGTVKINTDACFLGVTANAVDMDGTEVSLAFKLRYYDASTPASLDAGRIGVLTETDWTSTASTQDASMRFSVAVDGTVTEVARLTSGGQLQLPNTDTVTAGILIGGDTNIYRGSANYLYTSDSFAVLGTYGIAIAIVGTSKAEHTFISLQNTFNAVDMDGTETTILFRHKYYDVSSPQQVDSAKITVGTETDWTSTASTQDGYLKFQVVDGGTVKERLRIDSNGKLYFDGNAALDTNLYRSGANVLTTDDWFRADLIYPITGLVGDLGFSVIVTGDSQTRMDITKGGVISWGDGSSAKDTNLYRSSANQLATDDAFYAVGAIISDGGISATVTGTVKTLATALSVYNYGHAADMDGTITSIAYYQMYDDATPVSIVSGRVVVGTETDWTSTANTQDSYMGFYTTVDGVCAEKMRITSGGDVYVATAGAKLWFYDGVSAYDTNLYRTSANMLVTDDNFVSFGYIQAASSFVGAGYGTVKTNRDRVSIKNNANAVDMDGTESSILWQQQYYDASAPAYVSAGRIGVFTESDWTSTASTQDASMRFSVAIDGVCTEVARLTSGGQLQLPNTGTTTAGIRIGGDCDIYRDSANKFKIPDILSVDGIFETTSSVVHYSTGSVKTNNDILMINNATNAVDMDVTEVSVLFRQTYYDVTTPAYVDAARITFGTETDWTSTASTQDGYLKFGVVVDGTVTERLRITSDGRILMSANGKFATEKHQIFTISGKDEIDISSSTDNTGGIVSLFPNGTPVATTLQTSIALYGTDFESDATNYNTLNIEKWNAHADLGSNWIIRPAYGGSGTQLDLEIWQQRTGAGAGHQKLMSFRTGAGADCYTEIYKPIITSTTVQMQFRDSAIHVESADDGHLDLTADTSIDLNGAVSAVGILTMTGDYDIQFGNAASELLWYDGASTYDVNLKRGGANLLQTDDSFYAVLGVITKYDTGDYGVAWAGYTPPTGTNGMVIVAHNTNDVGSDRLYFYSNSAWKYISPTG